MSDLRARQFRVDDFQNFDFNAAMNQGNLRNVEALRSAENATPIALFAPMAVDFDEEAVPDPYYMRNFNDCLDLLKSAATAIAALSVSGRNIRR